MAQRAGDGEKIALDEKKIKKIQGVMKKFSSTKKTDPEHAKTFKVIGGLDYACTDKSIAAFAFCYNWFDKKDGTVKFFQEPKKDEIAEVEIEDYPEVEKLFENYVDTFASIKINASELENLINFHEAMVSLCKMDGDIPVCRLKNQITKHIEFSIRNVSKLVFSYVMRVELNVLSLDFNYDPELMLVILKSIKDLKGTTKEVNFDYFEIYYKEGEPLFFLAKDRDYHYNFAIQRKLTR